VLGTLRRSIGARAEASRSRSARGRGARLPHLANLVELLVEREDLLEQGRRHLRGALLRPRRRQPLDREQVLDARDRLRSVR
jgi:hypothetical protein